MTIKDVWKNHKKTCIGMGVAGILTLGVGIKGIGQGIGYAGRAVWSGVPGLFATDYDAVRVGEEQRKFMFPEEHRGMMESYFRKREKLGYSEMDVLSELALADSADGSNDGIIEDRGVAKLCR